MLHGCRDQNKWLVCGINPVKDNTHEYKVVNTVRLGMGMKNLDLGWEVTLRPYVYGPAIAFKYNGGQLAVYFELLL